MARHIYSSVYDFNDKKSIEDFCNSLMENLSKKFMDIKPNLFRKDNIQNSNTLSAYSNLGITIEEKVAIKLDFDNAKIKKIYRSDFLRIILLETKEDDEDFAYEFVDSLVHDNIGDRTKSIIPTLITNGLPEGTTNRDNDYAAMVSDYAYHMINMEFVKHGVRYSSGDISCLNGITRLEVGLCYSSYYLLCCKALAELGIVQLLTSEDYTYDDYVEDNEFDEDPSMVLILPKFLWDAISRSNYDIHAVSDDDICDYIVILSTINRKENEEESNDDELEDVDIEDDDEDDELDNVTLEPFMVPKDDEEDTDE